MLLPSTASCLTEENTPSTSNSGIAVEVKKIIDELSSSGVTRSRGILASLKARKEMGIIPQNTTIPKVS